MNKKLIIAAAVSAVIGALILISAIFLIRNGEYENRCEGSTVIDKNITAINISSTIGDIRILPSDTDKIKVTYAVGNNLICDIKSENGILNISQFLDKSLKKWYDNILSFNFNADYYILLEIPKNFTADINISAQYGDAEITGVNGNLTVEADFGDVEIESCNFKKLRASLDCGDIEVTDCKAAEMNVETDKGDCEITTSSGNMTVSTDLGSIELDGVSGDIFTLKNNCGDCIGTIIGKKSDYKINAETELGECNLENKSDGTKLLDVSTELGDILIKFID